MHMLFSKEFEILINSLKFMKLKKTKKKLETIYFSQKVLTDRSKY